MAPLISISTVRAAAAAQSSATNIFTSPQPATKPLNSGLSGEVITLLITTAIVSSVLLGLLGLLFLRRYQERRRAVDQEREEVIEARQMKNTDHTLTSHYSMIDLEVARSPSPRASKKENKRESIRMETRYSVSSSETSQITVPERKTSIPFPPYFHHGIKPSRSVSISNSRRGVTGLSPPTPAFTRMRSEPALRSYTQIPESFKTFGFDISRPSSDILSLSPEGVRCAYYALSPLTQRSSKTTRKFQSVHADLSPPVSPKSNRVPLPSIETTMEHGDRIQSSRLDPRTPGTAASLLLERTISKYAPPISAPNQDDERDDTDERENEEEERKVTPLSHLSIDMTLDERIDRLEAWLDGAPALSLAEEAEFSEISCPFQRAKMLEIKRRRSRMRAAAGISRIFSVDSDVLPAPDNIGTG